MRRAQPVKMMFIFIVLLAASGSRCLEIDEIVWTDEEESFHLTEDVHKVAFTDEVLETVLKREVDVIVANSRLGGDLSRIPSCLLLPDPLIMPEISFKKAQTGLFDIDFKAWDLKLTGLLYLKVKNLHALRHLGLRDIRVVAQLVAPVNIVGQYSLTGTGLNILPLYGNGTLSITIDDFMVTGETYLVLKDNKLYIKNIEIKMTEKEMDVNLENLMGDGLVGDVANSILDSVGEDILFNNEHLLEEWVQTRVEREITNFLIL